MRVLCLLSLLLCSCGLNKFGGSEPSVMGNHTLGRHGSMCGGDYQATLDAQAVALKGDQPELRNLLSKEVVMYLKTGTVVKGFDKRERMTHVSVLTGDHQGKNCWMATSLLFPD